MTTLPRAADRSWWLEETLTDPDLAGDDAPPLDRDVTADVVIVGGGYTGMWSAYFLKERQPDLDVVLLEQDICGGGPSGRNGGFLNAFYDELGLLVRRFGDEGRRAAEMAARSIDEIGEWSRNHGVDIWYRRTDDLGISSSPAQDRVVEEVLTEAKRLDVDDVYRPLRHDALVERFDSPVARDGLRVTHAAHVQPARLARALRRVIQQRGVRVHERTPVSRFSARPRVIAETPGGTVRARRAILGVNAWAVAWRVAPRYLQTVIFFILDKLICIGSLCILKHIKKTNLFLYRWG
jgi:glycine/D-amino acid oxidase-like deaminating enzyme